jgi:ABC-type transport system substrate-binding protein
MLARSWMGPVLAGIVAFGLLASGCGSSSPTGGNATDTQSRANRGIVETNEKPRPGGKLVYAVTAETNGWNPSTNQWAAAGLQITHTFFDTMTHFDDKTEIHPYFAESYSPNKDFTEWTFKFPTGRKFHNGKPVTAKSFLRDQEYLKKSPVTGGAYIHIDSFSAPDDTTFIVKTKTPWATLPSALSTQVGVVADPDWLESNDSLHPIGTGPFVFDTWEIGNKLVVKKNPDYWRKDADGTPYPYLDSVEFRVILDDNSRGAALQAKDIDMMQTISGQQVQDFQAREGYQILSDPHGEAPEAFIQLNTLTPPLDDVDARLALVYATDRNAVNEAMTNGFDEVADGPFGTTSPWYVPTGYPDYNPEKAKELVEKVKAKHNGDFTVHLIGSTSSNSLKLQQVMQGQWQAAGITTTLETIEQASLIIQVVTGNYMAVGWLQFDEPDPIIDSIFWDPEIATPLPSFSLNFPRNRDEEISKALAAARATPDRAEQKKQFGIVSQRFAADVPYLWLYHQTINIIASPRVVNFNKHTLPDGSLGLDLDHGSVELFQVWLKD